MTDPSRAYLTGLTSLTASILINGAVFFSVDHAVSKNSAQQFLKFKDTSRKEIVQFEFVEAPPVSPAEKPQKTRKIAERDTLAQDTSQGIKKDRSPQTRSAGLSEQLAQRPTQGTPSGLPSEDQKSSPKKESVSPKKSPARTTLAKPTPKEPQSTPKESAASSKAVPVLPGQGKILTQEVSRLKSRGAKLYGVTSFEATGSGMGIYMKNLKEKIWANWFPYVAFKFPRDFRGADAVIRFTLNAKGQVRSAKVVESKGTPIFATFCVEAIERARNFGPLPKEILALTGKDELEISFGFHYG